ncbi:MAG: sporulation transcription factor Spo0A [Lachnospiraceae bacterium]|nr:sporulation transcription factor Spo0A [Lachnospiraceae bacterium]
MKSVVIADDNHRIVELLSQLLKKHGGFNVVATAQDGEEAVENVRLFKPDILLLDIVMPKLDGIGVMDRINRDNTLKKKPAVVVITAMGQEWVNQTVFKMGAAYYIAKPFDTESVAGQIERVAFQDILNDRKKIVVNRNDYMLSTLQSEVTKLLHDIGVPAHIKGYGYLRDAVILAVNNESMVDSITKTLYPAIAKMNESTASRVERSIRHAIEVAWNRGNMDIIDEMFGYTINSGKGKPTNSEFIALVSDKIRIEYKIA